MKIRFNYEATLHLTVAPGDVLVVGVSSPEVERLLTASRLDGTKLAQVVEEDEDADLDRSDMETATVRHGRRGRESRTAVS